jgi:hypothetical protein
MRCLLALAALVLGAAAARPADLAAALATVRQVGPNAQGSAAAARAWQELAQADVGELPRLLAGMDGANAVARNWLRSAIDAVLERASANARPLPRSALEDFLRDNRHDPQARELAYELIRSSDKAAPERLLPTLLDDPSMNLRRQAVARLLEQADAVYQSDKKAEALPLYERALQAARDKEQLDRAARRLKEMGKAVDLAAHLGMILDWKLVGPFPNANQKGIDTAYPPEKSLDLAARYEGKPGTIHWSEYVSKDPYGVVDVNAALAGSLPSRPAKPSPFTEAVAYAAAEFTSPQARDVEVRLGSFTAFKLWVNGQLVLERGDAYTGMRLDHYVARAQLRPGKNTLLLKLAIDLPPPQLPKIWRFQLRVCDGSGAAILSTTRPAAAAGKPS